VKRDGHPLGKIEKSPYLIEKIEKSQYPQRFNRSPRNLARWRVFNFLTVSIVKFLKFKNRRWRRPPYWKIEKNCHISATVPPVVKKFDNLMQFDPFTLVSIKIFIFPKVNLAAAAILKNWKIPIFRQAFDQSPLNFTRVGPAQPIPLSIHFHILPHHLLFYLLLFYFSISYSLYPFSCFSIPSLSTWIGQIFPGRRSYS